MELPPRPTVFDFHGVPMTKYYTGEIQNFKARPEDILIATYPKSGTTWVCYILDLLYFGQTCPERQASIPLHERVPFLEICSPFQSTGMDLADQIRTTPRLIKTHLPVQLVPKSFWEQNSRIVYVARNAKDNAVSNYHFARMNSNSPEPGDWSTFLQNFMEGKVVYGSWYDHVSGWWEKKQTHSKCHCVFYEDLIKMDVFSRPELFDFHGVWMTHYFTDNWENVQNFQARPDVILLVSYPKAGSTWVSYILDLLCFGQTFPERDTSIPLTARMLHLEIAITSLQLGLGPSPSMITGTEDLDKGSTSPRLIRTHLPVQFLPKSFWEQNCKIVYVARNAKDSVVSYFHFERMSEIHPEPGEWSSYLQRFMEGKMVFGSWYDHVSSWWEKKQSHPKLHYMFYEDLVEDTGREMDKLCCFLGLSPSSEEKERITGRVQFDGMKENNMVNQSSFRALDFKKSSFMRKGKVGDWKNHFTVAQHEKFDEDYKQKMKNPSLQFRTEV